MKHLSLGLVGLFLILCVGLASTAWWVLKTEQGLLAALRVAPGALQRSVGHTLNVSGAQGTLWQGFTLGSWSWSDGKIRASGTGLRIELDWASLWQGKLWVKTLTATSVEIRTPPSKNEPIVLPERIDLPFAIQLDALNIQSLLINDMAIDQVQGRAWVRDGKLHVEQLDLTVQEAQVRAKAIASLQKPYAIDSTVLLDRAFDGFVANGKLDLTGSLMRLQVALKAQGQDTVKKQRNQSVSAQAVVMPFEPAIVQQVTAQLENFNPAQWFAQAPQAQLNLQARLQPNADFSRSVGDLQLVNLKPDRLQKGGVPIQKIVARFDVELKNRQPKSATVELQDIVFADARAKAGQASGLVQWHAPKPGQGVSEGPMEFALKVRALHAEVFADLGQPIVISGILEGEKSGQQVELTQMDLREGNARLTGTALMGLVDTRPLKLEVLVQNVDPARYMPKTARPLAGRLNGRVFFEGVLSANGDASKFNPQGELDVALKDSTLGGAPLILTARAQGGLERLSQLDLNLDVLGNVMQATGAYGNARDQIQLKVALNRLKELGQLTGLDLSGTANIQGVLNGVGPQFAGNLSLQVDRLRLDDWLSIDSIRGNLNLGLGAQSPWIGQIQVNSIGKPGAQNEWLETLTLQLSGTRSAHTLAAEFESGLKPFSRTRAIRGRVALTAGLKNGTKAQPGLAWSGVLTQLALEGLWSPMRSLVLEKPAAFVLGSEKIELGDTVLKGEDTTRIHSEIVRLANRELVLKGDIPAITLPRLAPILRRPVSVEPKNLVAKVQWNYKASPNAVQGNLKLSRVSGDLQVLEDSEILVPLKRFDLNLDFNQVAAKLDFDMQAENFGSVQANVRLPVEKNKTTQSWGLAADQPLNGSVAASFSDLSWLGPLLEGGVRTSGAGQVALALSGTANTPNVQGRVFANKLTVFQLENGVRLEDGEVVIDLTNDRARIEQFQFLVYNRQVPRGKIEELGPLIQGVGKITASGQWNLSGLDGGLNLKMDRVALLQRTDRWIMLNANVAVQQPKVQGQPLRVLGQIDTLGAYIERPEKPVQTLSSDVFVRGRSEPPAQGTPLDMNVNFSLGDLFFLNAQGLRTRLAGGLRLVVQDGLSNGVRRTGRKLQATGTIQALDGTYRAYGQDLSIVRGVVNFQGPLDNPGLNVRAVRKGVAVEAGVEITGSVQRPQVTLVSEPAVPDAEKLSWMITGRGSNSSDRDATLLLTAAAALFGDDDDSTTRKIAKALGIDNFSLSSGSLTAADSRGVGSQVSISPGADMSASYLGAEDPLLTQRIISLGKKLSDKIYLSYDQSVTTAAGILKLNYQYSRRLSFIARAGADTAIDTLYQFSYD